MQTSGFFYLQSFDPATQKYIESNNYFSFAKFFQNSGIIVPISYIQVEMTGITGTSPGQTPFTGVTGYYTAIDANPVQNIQTVNYLSETPNLSGIRFFCPISSPRIEMEYIDIGNSNILSGYVTGINIGSQNTMRSSKSSLFYSTVILTGITGTAPGQTPFTGVTGYQTNLIGVVAKDKNFNLGSFNSIRDSNLANNFGSSNTINSGYNLFQIGSNLSSFQIENSTLIGSSNSIISGSNILILGNNNTTEHSNSIGLLGRGNYLNNYSANIIGDANDLSQGFDGGVNILGNLNIIENSDDLSILGNSNYFSGTSSSFVVGENNYSQSVSGGPNTNIFILGRDSTAIESSDQIIFGNTISSTNSSNNTLFGKNISSIGNGNISFGAENIINSNNESIYGILNIANNSNYDFIAGLSNSLSGTNNNTVVGSNNTANRDLLDNLYLRSLTGITGLGVNQTPFTGVTGYFMAGGYSGIDPVGGNENFIVGQNNLTTLNYGVYNFGNDNSLLNNVDTYIFGANNYLEKNINSYAFGSNNSISGFQNYVIGNSNEVRSGDYNSIFIGINYTPTGANKVATISLASSDSKIEINPSQIRLDSINRPKINGENIIIQSEFDTIADSLNQNGPTFTTNTFQDSYYDKLANNIFLSSFNYDSGASTSLTSYAQEFSATSSLFLNKFNIYSTSSYTGASGFNVIYGNHTNSQFSPAWIVVDNSTSGVYYKNDITPFNVTPQSGWYATGFRENGLLYTGTSNNFGINLVMGSRQGYMSVNTALFGTMYVPFFY